ncbi:TetR/AcrR family transcriptional regulator [Sinosporangium siamense]|uniref:TetR family transcriptional regulator n=1 Tax=Sinosporangium siamense TaxID=1367973 RepID=A0A919V5V5_9ACTN|nr:TetR/AcrR family transcriptional regulator [Sinosporangium siamense]GII93420.1 TetR family transcriptional regulator [Sinosporangium siamense]
MSEGLRERKKRQTRERISEVAVGLFVARGFDKVTIAEVAEAAEVSVNTVYNYFACKEDLVLPPEEASVQRLADIVRQRPVGQSAAGAVLAELRSAVRRRDRKVGLSPGFGRVLEMMRAAPTLAARLEDLGRDMTEALTLALAEETGAKQDDLLPRVVAWQIGSLHALVYTEVGQRAALGESSDAISTALVNLLDTVEGLLSERVLTYATREGNSCSG